MNLYFYLDTQNQQRGPVSVERFAECGVSASTLVWCKGMDNWTPASAVPELREWFEQHPSEPSAQTQEAGTHDTSQGNATANSFGQTAGTSGTAQPGYGPGNGPAYGTYGNYIPCPPTHLVWAILSTLCCCLPLGIVAIVKSCEVSSHYARGNYDAALIASDDARRWCIYALVGAILVVLAKVVWSVFWGASVGLFGLLTDWGMTHI